MGETLQPGKIYIDGEPFEGFADVEELELATPSDDVLPKVSECSGEIEGTMLLTPEQYDAIFHFIHTVERVYEVVKQYVDTMVKIIAPIWERCKEEVERAGIESAYGITDLMDALLYAANDNPRWWHIYTHTKKRRIRKKYRDKLMRQLVSKMLSGEAHP